MDPNTTTGLREELKNDLNTRAQTWRQQKQAIHGTLIPENIAQMIDGLHKISKAVHSIDFSKPLSERFKSAVQSVMKQGASKLGVSKSLDDMKSLAASPLLQGKAIGADLARRQGVPLELSTGAGQALSVLTDPVKAADPNADPQAEAKATALSHLAAWVSPEARSLADNVTQTVARGVPTSELVSSLQKHTGTVQNIPGPSIPAEQEAQMRKATAPLQNLAKTVKNAVQDGGLDKHVSDVLQASGAARPQSLDDLSAAVSGQLGAHRAAAYKTGEAARQIFRNPTTQLAHDYAVNRLNSASSAASSVSKAIDLERSVLPHSDGINMLSKTFLGDSDDPTGAALEHLKDYANIGRADLSPLHSALLKTQRGNGALPLDDAETEALRDFHWGSGDDLVSKLTSMGSRARVPKQQAPDFPTVDELHQTIANAANQKLATVQHEPTARVANSLIEGSAPSANLRDSLRQVIPDDSPSGRLNSLISTVRGHASGITQEPERANSARLAAGSSMTASGQQVASSLSNQIDDMLTPDKFNSNDLARIPAARGFFDSIRSLWSKPTQPGPTSLTAPEEHDIESSTVSKTPTVDDDGWDPTPEPQPKLLRSLGRARTLTTRPTAFEPTSASEGGIWEGMKARGSQVLQNLKSMLSPEPKPAKETPLVMEPLHADDFEPEAPPAKRGVLARKLNAFGPQSTDKYSVRPGFNPETLEPDENESGLQMGNDMTAASFGTGGGATSAFTGASGSTAQYYQRQALPSMSAQRAQAATQAAGMGAMSADQVVRGIPRNIGAKRVSFSTPEEIEMQDATSWRRTANAEPEGIELQDASTWDRSGYSEPLSKGTVRNFTGQQYVNAEEEADAVDQGANIPSVDTLRSGTFSSVKPASVPKPAEQPIELPSDPIPTLQAHPLAVDNGSSVSMVQPGQAARAAELTDIDNTAKAEEASEDFSRADAIAADVGRNVKDVATDTGTDPEAAGGGAGSAGAGAGADAGVIAGEAAEDAADDGIGAAVTGLAGIGAAVAGVVEGLSAEAPPMPPIPSFSTTNNVNVAASNQPSAVDSALMT